MHKRLKLAYAICNYDNPLTGGELHDSRLVRGMVDFGMEPYDAWIDTLPWKANIFRIHTIFLTKILPRADILILDCGSTASLPLARLSRLLKPRMPIVGLIHYLKSERPEEVEDIAYWKRAEPQIVSLFNAIVCANPFVYRQVQSLGVPADRVHLNIGGYHPELLREKNLTRSNRLQLMFCGYVGRIKGVDVLIEALTQLDPHIPIDCHIVGSLSKEPGYAKKAIDDTISSGLESKVSFWDDLRGPALESIYAQCDVMVLPSLYEGYPLSIIEAQCQGLAVISTSVGGIPDAVEDGISGLLVPARDPLSLANAITKLANDPGLRRRLVEGGYKKVRSLPTWDETCREFAEIVRRIYAG